MAARLLAGLKAAVVPVYVTVPDTGVVPRFKVKVVVVIIDGSITSLKVAVMILFRATSVAAFAGSVEITVGGVTSAEAPVVKLQKKSLANALPDWSLTPSAPPLIVYVYVVLAERLAAGVKVAVLVAVAYVTVPVTGVPPGPANVNVAAVTVDEFIALLKLTMTFWLRATSVTPQAGDMAATSGGVLSQNPAIFPSSSVHPAMRTISSGVITKIAPNKPRSIPGRHEIPTKAFRRVHEPGLLGRFVV